MLKIYECNTKTKKQKVDTSGFTLKKTGYSGDIDENSDKVKDLAFECVCAIHYSNFDVLRCNMGNNNIVLIMDMNPDINNYSKNNSVKLMPLIGRVFVFPESGEGEKSVSSGNLIKKSNNSVFLFSIENDIVSKIGLKEKYSFDELCIDFETDDFEIIDRVICYVLNEDTPMVKSCKFNPPIIKVHGMT